MIAPTKTGITTICLSFCLYMVSMQSFSGLLFLLLGVLFGCFVINAFKARHAGKHLRLTPPESISTSEGDCLNTAWTLENTSSSDIGHIEVVSEWGSILKIQHLGPREIRHLTPKLKFEIRGVYKFSGLKLLSSYPFGLVRITRRIPCQGEIVVYPLVYICDPPVAAGFEPMLGGRFSGKYRSRTGDLFHGVKPFQPQDPVKLIHWRSSSKGLGLMVKEFDEELSGRVSIILANHQGKTFGGESTFDWAARAAGSLVLSALDAGFQVEFVSLSDLTLLSIPPFVDGDVVLDVLARVRPSPNHGSLKALGEAISLVSSQSGLSIILTELTTDFNEHLDGISRLKNRKVSLYLPSYIKTDSLRHVSSVKYFSGEEIFSSNI